MIRGTTPAGLHPSNEAAAARYVREMFGRVAPRYDLLNHLLSFQIDRYWRRFTVRQVADVLARPDSRALDVCCGTGDLLLGLDRAGGRTIFGTDFCRPMLAAARAKLGPSARLIEADALALPIRDSCFDVVTIAFGLRNLANYRKGLEEMCRLLRPEGRVAVLEFSLPPGHVLGRLYSIYLRHLLPRLGGAISGAGSAYRYLQQSVDRFPAPEELSAAMLDVGFRQVRYWRLTGGIAALHIAVK